MSSIPAAAPAPDVSAIGFTLAGALLVALALPVAGRLATTGLPRGLEIAAVVLAVLTVLAGLAALVLRAPPGQAARARGGGAADGLDSADRLGGGRGPGW